MSNLVYTQKNKGFIHAKAGFTLVELLLYIGISSTVLLLATYFLFLTLQARIKNEAIADVDQQGLQVMQVVTQTTRNAASISFPAIGGSGSQLTLDVYPGADTPTFFTLVGTELRITKGAQAAVALTDSHVSASGFTIQNLSRSGTPGTVRVTFTLSYVNPSGRQEYMYTKTFVGSASLRQP